MPTAERGARVAAQARRRTGTAWHPDDHVHRLPRQGVRHGLLAVRAHVRVRGVRAMVYQVKARPHLRGPLKARPRCFCRRPASGVGRRPKKTVTIDLSKTVETFLAVCYKNERSVWRGGSVANRVARHDPSAPRLVHPTCHHFAHALGDRPSLRPTACENRLLTRPRRRRAAGHAPTRRLLGRRPRVAAHRTLPPHRTTQTPPHATSTFTPSFAIALQLTTHNGHTRAVGCGRKRNEAFLPAMRTQ